jgi:hypothetical protein
MEELKTELANRAIKNVELKEIDAIRFIQKERLKGVRDSRRSFLFPSIRKKIIRKAIK